MFHKVASAHLHNVCMHVCMDVWMYVCMDVYMYVCMYIYTRINIVSMFILKLDILSSKRLSNRTVSLFQGRLAAKLACAVKGTAGIFATMSYR